MLDHKDAALQFESPLSRRTMLKNTALGFGALALAGHSCTREFST